MQIRMKKKSLLDDGLAASRPRRGLHFDMRGKFPRTSEDCCSTKEDVR
jgi:hypothetical protein